MCIVDVFGGIAGGDDDEHAFRCRVIDGVLDNLRESGTGDAQVEDFGAVVGTVDDGLCDRRY